MLAIACASRESSTVAGDAAASSVDGGSDAVDGNTIIGCTALQPGDPAAARIPPPYAGMTNPLGSSAADRGEELFPIWCARCHGVDAKGGRGPEPPPADLTAARRAEDYLFWRISEGGHGDPICSQMPAFAASLSSDERWALVAYLRRIEPEAGAP